MRVAADIGSHIGRGIMALLWLSAAAPPARAAGDIFGDLQGLKLADSTAAAAASYAARDDFSRASLSPGGTRVAMEARNADDTTTLLVLDAGGQKVRPLLKLQVPYQTTLQGYGWVDDDHLVAWVNIDNTQTSTDDNPSTTLYIAQVDLKSHKVIQREQPMTLSSDAVPPYPLSSELVRAPWRMPGHALISECTRANGFKTISRTATEGYTFPPDPPASSQVYCQLRDWDLAKNRAGTVGRALAAYPARFYASGSSTQAAGEGRKLGGRIVAGRFDPVAKKWNLTPVGADGLLLSERDSSEEDFPELWARLHRLLPDAVEPAGSVVKSAGIRQQPVGVQFERPERTFVALSDDLRQPAQLLEGAFKDSTVTWLEVSEDHNAVLFSVQGVDDPGAYYLWRRTGNEALRLTAVRASAGAAPTTLEAGWFGTGVPVAITRPQQRAQRGLILMPLVVSDEAAGAELTRFSTLVQWFAANGLTVVQVPVGVPGTGADALSGDAWRNHVAERLMMANQRARTRLRVAINDRVCLYGAGTAGYAALAASALGSQLGCVIAWDTRLDPVLFSRPYALVTGVPTNTTMSSSATYFNLDNRELVAWRGVYGGDPLSAAPSSWNFGRDAEVMFGFTMYDSNRALSALTGPTQRRIAAGGGSSTLFSAQRDVRLPDRWRVRAYEAMLEFVLPPKLEARKQVKIYVEDVDPQ